MWQVTALPGEELVDDYGHRIFTDCQQAGRISGPGSHCTPERERTGLPPTAALTAEKHGVGGCGPSKSVGKCVCTCNCLKKGLGINSFVQYLSSESLTC